MHGRAVTLRSVCNFALMMSLVLQYADIYTTWHVPFGTFENQFSIK
jgi:hypothetical protein